MKLTSQYRIFISYAHDDAMDIALKLRNDLAGAGHDPWLDLAEIAAGSNWATDIEGAIERCDVAVLLMSHGSYVSDICRAEQLRAIRKGKRIVPVLVQGDADRPLHLEHVNYIDFSDLSRYEDLLPALLEYVDTGFSPSQTQPVETLQLIDDESAETRQLPPIQPIKTPTERKRDVRAFRRYLNDLREEAWLGERHWWTYFLFYFADVTDVAQILTEGLLKPPQMKKRWDRTVRMYFRPRTPDLFGAEGIRPVGQRSASHMAVPVYLLFDIEGIITRAEARFSEGDLNQNKKTMRSATSFRDLPFDLIYHDTWIRQEERDEVLYARRAQVILPDAVELDDLQHIMCRSEAECETLLTLLPEDVRRRWQPIVDTRAEYNLFNNRWLYVRAAQLMREGVHFAFNAWDTSNHDNVAPMQVRAEIETDDEAHDLDFGEMTLDGDLALDLTAYSLPDDYVLYLYLDDALVYAGRYTGG